MSSIYEKITGEEGVFLAKSMARGVLAGRDVTIKIIKGKMGIPLDVDEFNKFWGLYMNAVEEEIIRYIKEGT